MAREFKRIAPSVLKEDNLALIGLRTLTDFVPSSPEFSAEGLLALQQEMEEAEDLLVEIVKSAATQRDRVARLQTTYHERLKQSKNQVVGQYGPDSPEVQVIGLKRQSEYRRPRRSK
jgi:cell division GTPase FtsZ